MLKVQLLVGVLEEEVKTLLQEVYTKYFGVSTTPFGFFNVLIKTPDYLEHPIIQTRVKTPEGFRTMAPLGTWEDVLFSSEMYNAEGVRTIGYDFTVKSGFMFKGENIFKGYVDEIYKIKQDTPPSDPMYFVSKLLLNSLYGKFGMGYELEDHKIINSSNLDTYLNNPLFEVSDFTNLSNSLLLISYIDNNKYSDLSVDPFEPNISIGIASAITAYSRMIMSKFKNRSEFKLFYSDTDSVYVSGNFPEEYIGIELGKFKLENTFTDIVFLAPKVYAGITLDNKLIVKIKGLTRSIVNNDISLDMLSSLLQKDASLSFNQIKQYKSLTEGTISLLKQTYELVPTESKRALIYKDGILAQTKPYVIDNNKSIK